MSLPVKKTFRCDRGIALIITLVLLSLLVIVMLSMVSLVRVENQVAVNSDNSASARQNALMGLNLALGSLQRYAGLDKVTTARSDITSTSSLTQPYFTGTWDSGGTLTSWLVSGNENAPTTGVTPSTALDASTGTFPVDDSAGRVYLLGKNSVTSNAEGVLVAKQALTAAAGSVPGLSGAATIGNYAWWVGDEGIKASVSLNDPLQASGSISYNNAPGSDPVGDDWSDTVKKERLNQLQLPRPRIERQLSTVDPDVAANVSALPKVNSLQQLRYLTGAPAAPTQAEVKGVFHDFTPISRGVLANTATGKLRTDLSASTGTSGAITSYQLLRPANVPAEPSPPSTPQFVAEFYPIAPNSTAGTWPTYGIIPSLSEAGVRFYFTLNGGNLVTNVLLDAEIWNAYAATLKPDANNKLQLKVTFPAELKFRVSDGATPTPTTQDVTIAANTSYTAEVDTSVEWQAGLVISLKGGPSSGGGSALSSGPFSPGSYSVDTSLATVATVETLDTVRNLKFELQLVTSSSTQTLQELTVGDTFAKTTAPTNPSVGAGVGYGYEFIRDLRKWTSSGSPAADYRDPRLPVMLGNFVEPYTPTTAWRLAPEDNTGGISGGGDIKNNAHIVLFDLPRQEIISVAQLRHMIGAKAYELGNSWGGLVNDRFDSEFVSTVPRNYNWAANGTQPLPNRYLEVYFPESVSAATLTDLRDTNNTARYQLIRGAFNINSTSISAWKAVLGAKFTTWKHSGSSVGGITLDNAFFRTDHGAQQRPVLSGSTPPVPNSTDLATLSDSQLLGATGRQLDEKFGSTEITNLATEIVRLLKQRGKPFASLADFVNSGIIQTAIDNKGLNNAISNAELRYTASGITQADVIACIAPFMAARSDTFVIRSYGDIQNPVTGTVEGRAWCEAVVQRVPDLASDARATVADVIDPPSPASSNKFGRRFNIVSFRWLTSDDL